MNTTNYSTTILAAIIALVGLAIIAYVVLPNGPAATIFSGLIVVVVLQLLQTRQADANGHRLTRAEDNITAAATGAVIAAGQVAALAKQADANTGRLDAAATLPARPLDVVVTNTAEAPVPVEPVEP